MNSTNCSTNKLRHSLSFVKVLLFFVERHVQLSGSICLIDRRACLLECHQIQRIAYGIEFFLQIALIIGKLTVFQKRIIIKSRGSPAAGVSDHQRQRMLPVSKNHCRRNCRSPRVRS